jgi:hypothetical protein
LARCFALKNAHSDLGYLSGSFPHADERAADNAIAEVRVVPSENGSVSNSTKLGEHRIFLVLGTCAVSQERIKQNRRPRRQRDRLIERIVN